MVMVSLRPSWPGRLAAGGVLGRCGDHGWLDVGDANDGDGLGAGEMVDGDELGVGEVADAGERLVRGV